jgi:NAD+ diphosphatase
LASGLWFAFRGGRMLVRDGEGPAGLAGNPTDLGLEVLFEEEIGVLDGRRCFAAEVEGEEPAGFSFQDLRSLFGALDETFFMMAGRDTQVITWNVMHRFCGRCGTRTDRGLETERFSRVCPKCGALYFPRLNPAAIVLVYRADEVLLARAPQFPKGMYSTLAGFVEPGETIEQTVGREVREEVGVEVKNITYFGSQPWPFPNAAVRRRPLALGLLESVVDGHGVIRVGLLTHPGEGCTETLFEELPRLLFATVEAVGRRDELRRFGDKHRPENIRVNAAERTSQPHVEEVREISVAYVVVVGRIGRDDWAIDTVHHSNCILLTRIAKSPQAQSV